MDIPSYPVFNDLPATGPAVGPIRTITDVATGVKVTLAGPDFRAQVQVSNAAPGRTAMPHLFVPPEDSWDTVATAVPNDPPVDLMGPLRYVRVVLESGTLTGGNIAESRTHGNMYGTPPQLRQELLGMIEQGGPAQAAAIAEVKEAATEARDAALHTASAFSGTLATLAQRGINDGPQFADGSRWLWQPNGMPNGGTVVAAGGGGVWVREQPRYSAAEFGGNAQAAFNATPYSQVTDLRTGAVLSNALVLDGMRNVVGAAAGAADAAPLMATAALSGPVVVVRPPNDNNSRDGMVIENLSVFATAPGTTDAVLFDLTDKRRMHGVTVRNPFLRSANGYALNVVAPNDSADHFAISTFSGGTYDGGLRIKTGGDSISIRGGRFTGPREALIIDLISNALTGAGDSSQVLIDGINTSARLGMVFERAKRIQFKNSNCEVVNGPGADDAVLSIRGAPGDPVRGGTIADSYFASASAKYGIRLGITDGITLRDLTVAVSGADATNAAIWITADSKNIVLDGNLILEGPANNLIKDEGVGTMGLWKPIANVSPLSGGVYPQMLKRPAGDGGIVFLTGDVSDIDNKSGTQIGWLAPGFRPAQGYVVWASAVDTGGAQIRVKLSIQNDGPVVIAQAVSGVAAKFSHISLSGIQFQAPRA